MPIHPTFNLYKCLYILFKLPAQKMSCIPKLSPTHHHASRFDGHVLHLQSNTITTIRVKLIYLCFVTKNHTFPIINGPILIPLKKPLVCKNMFTIHKWLHVLHLCTQSSLSQSMPHSDIKQQITCFKSNLFCLSQMQLQVDL